VGLTHVGFGLDKTLGWSSETVDKVVFAREASWSDKDEFFLLSEIGVRGASGVVDFEQVVRNFL
jgi:hypothetical protein